MGVLIFQIPLARFKTSESCSLVFASTRPFASYFGLIVTGRSFDCSFYGEFLTLTRFSSRNQRICIPIIN